MNHKWFYILNANKIVIIGMVFNYVVLLMTFLIHMPVMIKQSCILISIIIFAILIILMMKFIIIPQKKIEEIVDKFLCEGDDEIFEIGEMLSPSLQLAFNKLKDIALKTRLLDASNQSAQYLALQNQINPHFLYNTLESIRSDALYGGLDEVAEVAGALSMFFRYTISDMDKISTLSDELENVENYFIVQKYRFIDRIEMKIEIPNDPQYLNLKIPRLTLQPLVENAIIHGVECNNMKGEIIIHAELLEKGYYIYIIDNGIGISLEKLNLLNEQLRNPTMSNEDLQEQHHGIALRNVSQRIKLIFGDEFGIHIYSAEGVGTRIAIWLPILYGD